MTSPLDGGLVGFQTSAKDIDFGWARGDPEQLYERLFRNLRQVDAALAHQWAFNPRQSLQLSYAHFGGIIDNGSGWELIPNGTVTLVDDAVNFVERDASGVVTANQTGFTYPTHIPMAQVTTRNGIIVESLDRRPELGSASGGGGVGCTDFPCLAGQILPGQVPVAAVAQYLTRVNLPSAIAYEDEANVFTQPQSMDTIQEATAGVGVTVDGVLIRDLRAHLSLARI